MGNEQSTSSNKTSSVSPYHPHITVVNPAPVAHTTNATNSSANEDPDLTKLASIPKFLPIIRSSINLQNDPNQLPHMVTGPLLQLSMRLQNHLRFCSETIQTDQMKLMTRMKDVDVRSNAVQQRLNDKHKRFTSYCEQSKKLRDLATSLKRLDQSLTDLAERMRTINLAIPIDERLPTLSFRSRSS